MNRTSSAPLSHSSNNNNNNNTTTYNSTVPRRTNGKPRTETIGTRGPHYTSREDTSFIDDTASYTSTDMDSTVGHGDEEKAHGGKGFFRLTRWFSSKEYPYNNNTNNNYKINNMYF